MLSGRDLALRTLKQREQAARFSALPAPNLGVAESTAPVIEKGSVPSVDDFARDAVQGVFRGTYVMTQLAGGSAMGMTPDEIAKISYQPQGVETVLFGKNPVSLGSEGSDFAKMFGVDEKYANEVGAVALAGFTAFDVISGGRAKPFMQSLKNADNAADVASVLREVGFQPDIIDEYTPYFIKAKTDKEVGEAMDAAVRLQETTYRVENAPIRPKDDAEIVTLKGRVLAEEVESVKARLVTALDEIGEPEYTKTRDELDATVIPSVRQLTKALDEVKAAGLIDDELDDAVADIRATVKTEPQRFLDEEVPQTNVLMAELELESAEPVTVDMEALKAPGIFKPENRLAFKQAVKTEENATALREKYVSRLVDVEEEIVQQGGKEQASTALMTERADLKAGIKAIDESIEELPVTKAEVKKPVKKLDEVANPVKEKMGMLNVNLQQRYGKAAITKSKAEKFAANEKKVFFEVQKYLEEVAYVAENGGTLVQKVPDWVPAIGRDLITLENVARHVQEGSLPASHASREMEVYTAMVDEVARRSGVKEKPQKAVDAEGAIIEAMRSKQRRPGDKTKPLVKTEKPVSDAAVVDESAPEIFSQEEAVAEYNKFLSDNKGWTNSGKEKKKRLVKPYLARVDFSKLQDTTKFKSVFRDMYRNAEKVFGEHWPVVKKEIFDPFDASKGRMVDEEKALTDAVYKKIVVDLGIKKGSKESRAVMDLGEGATDYDSVVREFGKEKADQIVDAVTWFRGEYDRMIDEVNAVQRQVYPNDESKITPKRRDYFRHYEEMSIGFANMFEDPNLGNLPSTLRPDESRGAKSKWQSFKQQRLGVLSRRDAVGGFLNYIPQFTYTKHIDPEIARMREFIKDLEAGTETSQNLGNFIEGVRKWADDLAGQANFVDRFVENIVPGGRRSVDVLDFLNKRAKRNAILGNIGASVSQIFNVPGAIAAAGPAHSLKAVLRTMGEIVHAVEVRPGWEQGTFIKERYRNSMYSKFDTKLIDQPMKLASWLLGVLDEVGTKFSWNAHYEKALTEGILDPVKYADDMARKSVAGRGIGEVPTLQKSKMFQTVAPFQLEVMNMWWLMKDFVDEKEYAKFVTLFAAYFVFNEVAEEIKGTSVGFDPVQAFYDSYKIYEDELIEPADKTKRIVGRLTGEVLTSVPMGSYAVSFGAWSSGMDEKARKEFFGEGDPVRFGNMPLVVNAVTDPLFGILPRWGGAQMEKTWEGLTALAEGKIRSNDGVVMHDLPIEPGAWGVSQTLLFGPRATNFEYRESVEAEMRSFYRANIVAVANGQTDVVKKELSELPEHLKKVYIEVAKEEKKREEDIAVKNMVPTYLMATALVNQGKMEEAKAILDRLSDKEKELYLKAAEMWNTKDEPEMTGDEPKPKKTFNDRLPLLMRQRDVGARDVSPDADKWVIETAVNYAYAFGLNPQQAFEIVFLNNDVIRDTVGGGLEGVVRTERMPFLDGEILEGSDSTKEALMKDQGISLSDKSEYYLEHKIPLGFGGSNEPENLFISTKEQHDEWTGVETLLTDAVKEQRLDYRTAQELILRYKGYGEKPITREEIQAIINGN